MGNKIDQVDVSSGIFVAGVNLWSVMLEVDNREARLVEAVVAASFLATYGQMSVGWNNWRNASTILCNAVTADIEALTPDRRVLTAVPAYALVSYIFLIDTLQATHCGLAANISTKELFIKLPGSDHQFCAIYHSLLQGNQIPQDVHNEEDALLLLTALLSDVVYAQRCLQLMSSTTSGLLVHGCLMPRSPFTPLSAASEFSRLNEAMTAGLSRWERIFENHVGKDILALQCFCKLQLICPDTWKLPQMAGYGETQSEGECLRPSERFEVSDKAAALAWQVLNCCHHLPSESKLAVWLPVIVFLCALTIWQKLRTEPSHYGSLRVLDLFSKEIAGYHWPCSIEMVRTLERLMQS
ncbi:hypothetical protein PV08_03665 [Exophiala spinifera]|uniref:Transcription factor domain-containing protein n=1 Tax=Exophiala spinifera TaxID=91928 RepID=A0A0D2BLB4_9EURO|nr:uncharacterized protein PV08_03665 [Exophiala spinifera]KIW19370.1 hypothetical protein PV08_03665 [Exophiala spinifera]